MVMIQIIMRYRNNNSNLILYRSLSIDIFIHFAYLHRLSNKIPTGIYAD